MVRLTLKNGDKMLSINDYIKAGFCTGNMRFLNSLPEMKLAARVLSYSKTETDSIVFEISNPSKTIAVSVKLNLRNPQGERILPAYFSDGYFNLLPNEKRTVSVECGYRGDAALTVEGYNVTKTEVTKVKMQR